MKTLAVSLSLFLVLTSLALGQNGPKSVDETVSIADFIYRELGPNQGAVFYEPLSVLVLSGRVPISRHEVALSPAKLKKLNSQLEKSGLMLEEGKDSFQLISADGLRARFSGDLPDGAVEWPAGQALSDYQAWKASLGESLEKVYLDKRYAVASGLYNGEPDEAVSFRHQDGAEGFLYDDSVRVRVPGSETVAGRTDPEFKVLAKDIDAPEVVRAAQDRGEFLSEFYSRQEVKDLINSEAFLAARFADKNYKSGDSPREDWLSGKFYDAFELRPYTIYDHHERVLTENIDQIVALIESKESPQLWLRALNTRLDSLDQTPLTRIALEKLIWAGGYAGTPARSKLFNAVKKVQPDYLSRIFAERLKLWEEKRSGSEEELGRATVELFTHPVFQEHYLSSAPEQRRQYRSTLVELKKQKHVRAVLDKPPYKE